MKYCTSWKIQKILVILIYGSTDMTATSFVIIDTPPFPSRHRFRKITTTTTTATFMCSWQRPFDRSSQQKMIFHRNTNHIRSNNYHCSLLLHGKKTSNEEEKMEDIEDPLLDSTNDDQSFLKQIIPKTTMTTIQFSSFTLWMSAILVTTISAMSLHTNGWIQFLSSIIEMKTNSTESEFSSAVLFWSFAAIIHPFLQPIFGISEILHGTPWIFWSGSILMMYIAWTFTSQFLITTSLGTLFYFLTYIGSGLDGTMPGTGGDYNIALDDSYQEENGHQQVTIVKGCPTYDQIRSKSMSSTTFDLSKYQGKWYWQKVHDWTQFQQLYDTTLDIELVTSSSSSSPEEKDHQQPLGYINKLSLKGPSPRTSPYSWDKSPLANGIHYYWTGSNNIIVEEEEDEMKYKDDTTKKMTPSSKMSSHRKFLPPGSFIESGFGVQFPNYIIDVVPSSPSSSSNGDEESYYDELIQFQCIEVGGVRLYEGIDFMTRSPTISEERLEAMQERAKAAGLYPYGASPEQMHRIERRVSDEGGGEVPDEIDNAWQTLWRRLGVVELLDRLSELENAPRSKRNP